MQNSFSLTKHKCSRDNAAEVWHKIALCEYDVFPFANHLLVAVAAEKEKIAEVAGIVPANTQKRG